MVYDFFAFVAVGVVVGVDIVVAVGLFSKLAVGFLFAVNYLVEDFVLLVLLLEC